MAEATRNRVGAHVFHRGDQDLLIARALAPLCGELARAGCLDEWFFLRHWEGGPHVRLRLCATSPVEDIRSAVVRTCTRHLAEHPSPPGGCSQREYESSARRRAEGERMSDWDRRLRQVDTVEFVPYRPEHGSYGDGTSLRAVERHFTESSRIAAQLLAARHDQRAAAALAMLTLSLAVCEPDLDRATSRFAAARTRPQPSSFAHDRRDDLREQTRRLWADASADPATAFPPNDPPAAWLLSVRALHATLSGLRDRGDFAPADVLSPFACLGRALHPEDPVIDFVLLRCTHLLCNRLGLPSATEAGLALLTARTLSELHEVAPL